MTGPPNNHHNEDGRPAAKN